ncbi:MAG TPA: transglutaminase domain-containing protein [Gemmataceae bacterium]|jgi:transglutaminase-like putative cysteine protease|nr:transglutaminase domain-containing protein [Gemmataceae bacterium]
MFRVSMLLCMTIVVNGASSLCAGPIESAADDRVVTYQIRHALMVKEIPEGATSVRIWFWLPDDDDCQKVLDLSVVEAPSDYRVTRDAVHGHRYLYAERTKPAAATVRLATDFVIRRQAMSLALDPTKAGPLTEVHRKVFAEYLRRDCPNMEVTERVAELANNLCGDDANVVTQARKLFDFVVSNTSHYSIAGAPKSSGKGSVEYCLDMKGGGCTDQHALFIALARGRGIPTRLHFGSRLPAKNEGKDMDPGYRCWVTYFVPNYGWVPMDISAANTTPAERDRFFSGLDERRLRFSEGRDLELNPRQQGPRVNLFITAYVEVDGKPHAAFERTLRFVELHDAKR